MLKGAIALALANAMLPSHAQAQATSTPEASGGGLEEVVVTAQRRSENQQAVPIAITTFQGETLQDLGIEAAVDLPQVTPGLTVTRTLVGANVFLRGVGTTSAGYSTESPVAVYLDGLYLPNAAAAAFTFDNVDRIEVLRGPQGTLYGRNTTGGLIHVITREPEAQPALQASIGYGNYDTTTANFYGSVPLGETVAANLAVSYTDQAEGWYHNEFLNRDVMKFEDTGAQAKILWTPSDRTRVSLRGFFDKVETDQGNTGTIYPGSLGIDGTPYLGEGVVSSRRQPFAEQRQYAVSLKIEHDYDFATLTSITGYINNHSDSGNIQNGIVGQPVLGRSAVNLDGIQDAETFSEEINLASNTEGEALQWIAGLFFWDDATEIKASVYGTCVDTTCAAAPIPTLTDGKADTRSYSGYGEGTWAFRPTTRLTLGIRYTSDNKTLDGLLSPLPGFPNSIPALPPSVVTRPGQPPNGIDTDVTFSKTTYKAVFAQDFGDDVHAYASYNRGFKSGGYNPTSFTNPPSEPEIVDAFEMGVKSELFDRALRLNASAFYYDYQDIQLRSTAPPARPGGSVLFNAASADVMGIDVDFAFTPVQNLVINGAFEYLDTEYSDFPGGTCINPRPVGGLVLGGTVSTPCDLKGHTLPYAPEFSYSLGAKYTLETRVGSFDLAATDGYKSSFYWDPHNRLEQDAFHLLSASLTWTATSGRFSAQIFGQNLADEYWFVSGAEGAAGNDLYVPGAPRTYGLELRYKMQ